VPARGGAGLVAGGGRAAGLSEPRARAWLRRWRAGDHELADRRWGPVGRQPRRTDPQREAVIAELRGQVRMSAVAIAEALGMPERTVRGVIHRVGLAQLPPVEPREPANRYERPRPGELIHIDVKKLGRIGRPGHRVNGDRTTRSRGIGWEFVHVCIDDCTRLAYVEVLDDERKQTVTAGRRSPASCRRRSPVRRRPSSARRSAGRCRRETDVEHDRARARSSRAPSTATPSPTPAARTAPPQITRLWPFPSAPSASMGHSRVRPAALLVRLVAILAARAGARA
jgi:hypothetical protein